ncbi:antibiotic biosynthesis monooxygenase [Micrococcus flavus]|uniref:Quinol monooxygenase YgiN n=2 Tax=Micrococcus flavus TaxID=384602 RepID=A0A4Y8X115_9MICC|nr:antibiotic biosynthesis monooxygenase [Micrococcus flavus]MBB4881727.1 quinol monooxygenase YgiN [Micrococcus flavus]TFI01077.1 antibiotic biosynthesis monooxygenase [Micrococcus flavus]GGK53647.1 hypothetical protein GCM10007073_20830 [Micrococcus flavus]
MTTAPEKPTPTGPAFPTGPVMESVRLHVAEGAEESFEAAVAEAAPMFREHGATSFRLLRQVEEPQHYRLLVGWPRIEDHTEGFRNSPAFPAWRALVSPHLVKTPEATHWTDILSQA